MAASLMSGRHQPFSKTLLLSELASIWTTVLNPTQAQFWQLVTYEGEPAPLALNLSVTSDKFANQGIIPSAVGNYLAGGQATDGDATTATKIGCKVDWGYGAVRNTIQFDFTPGTYAIPACEYCNVSLAVCGAAPGTNNQARVAASVVPGYCEGQVPTRSEFHSLINPGDSHDFYFSPYTRAVEIYPPAGADCTLLSSGLYIARTGGGVSYTPPWSPVLRNTISLSSFASINKGLISSTTGSAGLFLVTEYLDFA